MSQINTKAFVKAIKNDALASGLGREVRTRLERLDVEFAERRWSDKKGDYKGTLKVVGGPETLDTADIRPFVSDIPSHYTGLVQAVETALNAAEQAAGQSAVPTGTDAAHAAVTGDIRTTDLVSLVADAAHRNQWCSSAEETLTDNLDLRFTDYDNEDDRFTLAAGNPETLTQDQVRGYVTHISAEWSETSGVPALIDAIRNRFLNGATATATEAVTAPAIRQDWYRITVETTLTASQVASVVPGWSESRTLVGQQVQYGSIRGRIVAAV